MAELPSTKTVLGAKEVALCEKVFRCGRVESAVSAAQAPISSGEAVMLDFTKPGCTGYTSLGLAQASCFHD